PVTPPTAITAKQLSQAQNARALYAEAHDQPAINEGPMLLLPSTECAPNMAGGAPLFSFYTPAMSSTTFPVYVGNIRFDTTSATSSASFLKFSTAMHQQITYILDSPILHYTCEESGHDAGALFAMQDTYNFAQSQTLSRFATTSDQKTALAALENRNQAVITQNEVEAYLHAANTLALPAALKSKVTDLSLSYVFTSAHFEASLGELVGDEKSNAALVKLGWPIEINVPYMFFIRSSFQMLLLGQNLKLFPPNTIPANGQPFVYYSQLPHTPAILQTLVHDIRFFYIIHTDPSLVSGLPKS
ncbi:MAG TPA: hypothetical protein VN665_02230, partial [Candidatus Paceibacterota bacterium]|nr:hypothetical protein [Candidatus Paceibacterota bacterium]